jgi:hypothetical protein
MPIVENTLTNTNTKFYNSFVPYREPTNTRATDKVSDMISVNYIRNLEATAIEYYMGAESIFSMDLQIKNITTNTTLEITVFSTEFFTVADSKFILEPGITKTVFLQTNNKFINEQVDKFLQNLNVKIQVKNLTNNLTFIRNDVTRLEQKALSERITVI